MSKYDLPEHLDCWHTSDIAQLSDEEYPAFVITGVAEDGVAVVSPYRERDSQEYRDIRQLIGLAPQLLTQLTIVRDAIKAGAKLDLHAVDQLLDRLGH